VGRQALLVTHQKCNVPDEEFRVPERGINLFFFQRRKRGKEKACPADNPDHHGHSPGEWFLLISTSFKNCCIGSLFCIKFVGGSSTNT
jgi:hypothetical protein